MQPNDKIYNMLKEIVDLKLSYDKLSDEYTTAKGEWDNENLVAQKELERAENEAAENRAKYINMTSDMDSLIFQYEQCVNELKEYGVDIEEKE